MSKFREYFTFTRSERNGILFLLIIIIALIVVQPLLKYFHARTQEDYSSFEKEVDQFISSVEMQQNESDSLEGNFGENTELQYFNFNPNTVSDSELIMLGLSKKVIKTWLNFRSKGGKFRKPEDVQRIWGLQDSTYQKLVPYIEIPADSENKNGWVEYDKNKPNYSKGNNFQPYTDPYKSSKTDNSIELNSADSVGLCSLPGIGPGFYKRIKRYRDVLGGFVKKEQLLEVYGFTPEMYSKVEKQVYVDKSSVKKININEADFKQLIRHPYFEKNEINKIFEYKRIQGKIINIQDLVKDKMITQEQCDKITPYMEY